MNERHVSVRNLTDLLPDMPEFDALRIALHRAAQTAQHDEWSEPSPYDTVDRRVIPTALLGSIISDAENEMRKRLKRLHDAANITFAAAASGRPEDKAEQLVALGAAAEAREQWRDAFAYYLLAHHATRDAADLHMRALIHRRVGRAALNVGEFARATHHYFVGLTIAAAATDDEGQLTAATGLGNVASYQGRWPEAEQWYANALSLAENGFARERAQLLVNLSMTARERGFFNAAHQHLSAARSAWEDLTDADRAGWYNNMGLLRLAEADADGAESNFMQALEGEPGLYHRAMVLENLAEVALLRGDLSLAEARCRHAEDLAIAHGSPRALAEIYLMLGRIAARRQDPNGVVFFEKALEGTRDRRYPLMTGEIFHEYGRFRLVLEDASAARGLFERALEVFRELGATAVIEEVEADLASLE